MRNGCLPRRNLSCICASQSWATFLNWARVELCFGKNTSLQLIIGCCNWTGMRSLIWRQISTINEPSQSQFLHRVNPFSFCSSKSLHFWPNISDKLGINKLVTLWRRPASTSSKQVIISHRKSTEVIISLGLKAPHTFFKSDIQQPFSPPWIWLIHICGVLWATV